MAWRVASVAFEVDFGAGDAEGPVAVVDTVKSGAEASGRINSDVEFDVQGADSSCVVSGDCFLLLRCGRYQGVQEQNQNNESVAPYSAKEMTPLHLLRLPSG
jgi:hypothetical protein